MRRINVVLLALVVTACGGSTPTAPTVPPPTPRASVQSDGDLTFPSCLFGNCNFQGQIKNFGPGCAANVRGVSRLLDQDRRELSVADWSVTGTMRVGETLIYRGCCFPEAHVDQPGFFTATASWDDVRC